MECSAAASRGNSSSRPLTKKERRAKAEIEKKIVRNGTDSAVSDQYTSSAANSLKLKADLSLKESGILDQSGKFTKKALDGAEPIDLADVVIKNPKIVQELTKDGSSISDWAKYKIKTGELFNGKRMEVHYYMNKVTGKIDYATKDFKIKDLVKP